MITTERLTIRPLCERDLPAVSAIHSDEETNRYLPYQTWQSDEDARAWYDEVVARQVSGQAEQFVIAMREGGSVIGTCLSFRVEDAAHTLRIGYVLNRSYWRQGYMHEAMRAFIDHLFAVATVERLEASVERGNEASTTMLKKLGFVFVESTSTPEAELDLFALERATR